MPIEVLMPALSPTMTEGNLAKWLKKEGDKVSPGDLMAEIETDKAVMELEAVDSGTIGKILVKDGTNNVKVNDLIAILLKNGESKESLENYKPSSQQAAVQPSKAEPQTEASSQAIQAQPSFAVASNVGGVKASPLAKRIAKENGVDISKISGTGPHGRVIKDDVLNAPARGVSVVGRNPNEKTIIPHNNIRKVIAKRLLEAKTTIPHFYLSCEVNITELLSFRERLNQNATQTEKGPSYKISVNDLVIKACAMALKAVPNANSSWSDEGTVLYNNIDISVAVSIDGGLITPIVKNADQKNIFDISSEMKVLAKKARDGKLQPEEFQGGSFSISNLGMYGVTEFKAIINPPQSCIIAVGASSKKPTVGTSGSIQISDVMTLSISCDHRVVDGALGATLLGKIKENLEIPALMFV